MMGIKENERSDHVIGEHHNPIMKTPHIHQGPSCEIRAAIGIVEDRGAFLQTIRTLSEIHNTHIICFNADMLAGTLHAHFAICHAIRSYNREIMISKTIEMEALLYAAGSRQCSQAARFGVHLGENHLYVCCHPVCEGVWSDLAHIIHFMEEDPWDCIDSQKEAILMDLFGISHEEIATTQNTHIVNLVLERIALLEVYR
jgi:KEOPS complex subunit Cgi121